MALYFVEQLIDLEFRQRSITLKTRHDISPSFSETVNELQILLKWSSNYSMDNYAHHNNLISISCRAYKFQRVVVKVSKSLKTDVKLLSFLFSKPSNRSWSVSQISLADFHNLMCLKRDGGTSNTISEKEFGYAGSFLISVEVKSFRRCSSWLKRATLASLTIFLMGTWGHSFIDLCISSPFSLPCKNLSVLAF